MTYRPQAGAIAALRQVIARTEAPEKVIVALRAVSDDASPLLRLEVVMPALASLERKRQQADLHPMSARERGILGRHDRSKLRTLTGVRYG